jgi:D-alanyl-D-alanine-carboxypeptidase/D-alanyl-D-alanine-endopeptidase
MKIVSLLVLALLPLAAADRKAAIDQLVQPCIESGTLPGVVVGVFEDGKTQIFAYGKAAPDSIFEIGSITKTFTTTALAVMVERKMVALEDPVRKYLPADAVPPGEGPEIRLIDLATQTSGLPRMPNNFHPKDQTNPYVDYSPQLLYEFLGKNSLKLKPNAGFLYSNLGMGLLGHALSLRYGKSYEAMITDLVASPLGMNDTRVTLTEEMQKRLATGHDADGRPVHNWDLDALAGAGAIRSSAADMLRYLQGHIEPPEKLKAAIELAHVKRAQVGGGTNIALAWFIKPDGKTYWHNGGTGGYTAYASFNIQTRSGVIVMINASGTLMDQIGDRVEHLLAGDEIEPLALQRPITLDSKVLDEYVGIYEILTTARFTVTRQGGQLFGQLPGQDPIGIYPQAKDRFFVRQVPATVDFERNTEGMVSGMVLHQNGRDTKAKKVQ